MKDKFMWIGECPICRRNTLLEFETDVLGNLGNEFKIGDEVYQNNIRILVGEIEKAKATCPKCDSHIIATILINDWKYENMKDVRESQWSKKKS